MQVTEQSNFRSEALTRKKNFTISEEQNDQILEGKSISERLWGQLEELEKLENQTQEHVDGFHQKRKKEEFNVDPQEENCEDDSLKKSPRKSTGVTPKLESLKLSRQKEDSVKRLEEFDLASLIEQELSKQQFVLESSHSEEPTKPFANKKEVDTIQDEEECDSHSGCDINEWVTGCQCDKCHKNLSCVGCGKKGCSNCLECCGECGSYICGNDSVREVEGCSLKCVIHRRVFCPNCVGFCDSCLEVVCPNDLTVCYGCDERYCSRCNDCPNCV
ncbi:hypothetical protein Gasu_29960 isoform 2 [Galdieria sulphuraria]|uniref:Uncharacterized protein n=1 Tax=Galdieria sulphuraria TaxID=130081 RepID=M2WZP5_GALSU|nr:hypothetical protein Gasu_29960 isoform 1 [Galdieria sulphuraria]XP_005706076.1 hypothetical protein Gasu_29960 isoform 2 [Galdieria sulphuraria]EME29555.1 hypothetical protein isoform 1 [Galdieria sulphuraria]EME29556.1 hypothetical protein isoform 2 [Galdieria sulphuraria]|eukprot:XP_005706075.1 hypothetical protein isoform 1 [Galdieria sulphuraria]